MTEISEVIFVSDTFNNISVWDLKNGTNVINYKSSFINHRCMDILKNDYVLAVEKGPLINAWPINSQEKIQNVRMLCPGIINCFSISSDGLYIAVSIEEKLLIWQISTGKLLCTVGGHYQFITVLKWTQDNSDIITGGEDGIVCVWKLSHLISANDIYVIAASNEISKSQIEPRYTFSDHSVKITDLFVGSGQLRARLFTASADKTCKIYDLATGDLLLSIIFNTRPTSITVDSSEINMFVGTNDGNIKVFSLLDPPRIRDYHFKENDQITEFSGHSKSVNCLSISTDGTALVSGSADGTVKIWLVDSRQCLRTIKMKGSVTNVIIRLLPKQLLSYEFLPTTVLKSFEKRYNEDKNSQLMDVWCPVDLFSESTFCKETKFCDELSLLHEKIELLQSVNRELYNFTVKNIVENSEIKKTNKKREKRKLI